MQKVLRSRKWAVRSWWDFACGLEMVKKWLCIWSHLGWNLLNCTFGRLGGSKTDFLRKVIPASNFLKIFQLFRSAVRSLTGRRVIARRQVGSDRSQNFSKNRDFWQFFRDFWLFSETIDFWPLTPMMKVVCRRKVVGVIEV